MALGAPTAVLTSCSEDLPVRDALAGADVKIVPSGESTTFRNLYDGSLRRQIISGLARPISAADVPPLWRRAPIVLLGPIAGEIQDDLFTAFPDSLLALTPQGMMRAWTEDGDVYPKRWLPPAALLARLDVLVLSQDDLVDPSDLAWFVQRVRLVAVTHAELGATVYVEGRAQRYPAYECVAADPTGAGDTFAAAFLLEMKASGSVDRAAHFANSAASFVTEAEGAGAIPSRSEVLRRMELGRTRSAVP